MKPLRNVLCAGMIFALLQNAALAFPKFSREHLGTPLDLEGYQLTWQDEFDTLNASRDGRGTGPWFSGVHAILVAGEEMAHIGDPAYSVADGILTMSTGVNP